MKFYKALIVISAVVSAVCLTKYQTKAQVNPQPAGPVNIPTYVTTQQNQSQTNRQNQTNIVLQLEITSLQQLTNLVAYLSRNNVFTGSNQFSGSNRFSGIVWATNNNNKFAGTNYYVGPANTNIYQSMFGINAITNSKVAETRSDVAQTLYTHTVVEGTNGTGINGVGLFHGMYLAWQQDETNRYPQAIAKMYSDYFRLYAAGSLANGGNGESKLYLEADGEIWLRPKTSGTGVGLAEVQLISGVFVPQTHLQAGRTIGNTNKYWIGAYIDTLNISNAVFIAKNNTLRTPSANGGWLQNSNNVLYWVTTTQTNLISDGR